MAYSPLYLIPFPIGPSGYVLKAYAANTSTPIQMAIDADGNTLVNTVTLNASGYPAVTGNIVILYLDQEYKIALYPSQAAADANSGAIFTPDGIPPPSIVSNLAFNGNTISSTNTNGDITLDPNGSGEVNLNATTNIQTADIQALQIGSVAVTPDATAFNQLDGFGLKGYITGFVPTAGADADHDLSFSAGACRNSADTISCKPAWTTLVKQIDAAWAEGTNQGGMATGTVAADTAYYYNLIRKDSDTTVFDIVADVSASNANTPAGWTFMREVHKEFTDGSANLRVQTYKEMTGGGIRSKFGTPLTAFTDTNPGTDLVTKTMPCPPGVEMRGTLVIIDATVAGASYIIFTEVGSTATEPDANNYTLFVGGISTEEYAIVELERFTDASRNIEYELSFSAADFSVWFQIFSWINHRRN